MRQMTTSMRVGIESSAARVNPWGKRVRPGHGMSWWPHALLDL